MSELGKKGDGMARVGASAVLMAPRRCSQYVWSCSSHWCTEVEVPVTVRRYLEGLVQARTGAEAVREAEVVDAINEQIGADDAET